MNTPCVFPCIFLVFLLLSSLSVAQQSPDFKTESTFAQYRVRHLVFNSTFIQPDVAKIYNIKRSKYESLLNVSVSRISKDESLPVAIKGTITNLMQQEKQLKFKEIKEDGATYYIAPIRVANEELLRFQLIVTPKPNGEILVANFSQTVYADE